MSPDRANKFCRSTDLTNEASVEAFFVLRLLTDLGYRDDEIVPKRSIEELRIPRGRQRERYKPDFLIKTNRRPRWLIDAKSTSDQVDAYTYQCAGYALLINRKFQDRPLRFYMLTNGLLTRVYAWDQEEPILSLRFADFVDGNTRYETLKRLLGAEQVRLEWDDDEPPSGDGHLLIRPKMDVVKRTFKRCHTILWKSEKLSVQAAFVEFAKLLFVKLWEDRKLRDDPALFSLIGRGEPLPPAQVRFSLKWTTAQQEHDPHPVNSLFRQLVTALEREIADRRRKRIFAPDERLMLSASTAKRIVQELEHLYLFGIDEDLNGRMFEAFLTATMRGRDLGQYFTPRSIVKLMTRLAQLRAGRDHIDKVLDGCCGTGGFLIEALTEMRNQVYNNTSLSTTEKTRLLNEIANEAIFGIDAGRDPSIARIARINMYLHGDGGSRVYQTDALRYPPEPSDADSIEVQRDVQELQQLLAEDVLFDCCLTNPPFSMTYAANIPDEQEVLQGYELLTMSGKKRSSLRSSVMFIEQYWRLMLLGGRFLTIIDDSVLNNKKWAFVRDFIRERFIIRAIISLHGDAFRGAGARVKTSVLYLTKKTSETEIQPAAFVYETRYVGLDDVVPRTPASTAAAARAAAVQEIDETTMAFAAFQRGERGPWLVEADKLTARLDAKNLRPWSVAKLEHTWRKAGATSEVLSNLVDLVMLRTVLDPDTRYTFIRVTYDGECQRGETRLGREVTYDTIGLAQPNDLVVSGMGAVYRAICVVPEGHDDLLISHEYTILRIKPTVQTDSMYLWSVLRSAAVVAEWLSAAHGLARHRVDWDVLNDQRVPLLSYDRQKAIGDMHRRAAAQIAESRRLTEMAKVELASLDLEAKPALDRLERAKPPK